jgi:hypothetical protein
MGGQHVCLERLRNDPRVNSGPIPRPGEASVLQFDLHQSSPIDHEVSVIAICLYKGRNVVQHIFGICPARLE